MFAQEEKFLWWSKDHGYPLHRLLSKYDLDLFFPNMKYIPHLFFNFRMKTIISNNEYKILIMNQIDKLI